MTQENKSKMLEGKTLIGTMAPVIPRQTPPPGSQPPTITPARVPTVPPPMLQPTVVPAAPPASATPTVAMRPSVPAAPGSTDPDMFVGQELCGYMIRRKLAEGGMGEVF